MTQVLLPEHACSTCLFFQASKPEHLSDGGTCHLNPPTVHPRGHQEWPPVSADAWCGQWQLNPMAQR